MKVSELAERAGVTREVVRYYTRMGLLTADRCENGYHKYDQQSLRYLQFIGKAKLLGFTLKQIREILSQAEKGESPCQLVRAFLQQRLDENRNKIHDLTQLQSRMEQAVGLWESLPDSTPEDGLICVLIESID